MNETIDVENLIKGLAEKILVFDVRTPAEFEKGHIPGAINLPLFSDAERVDVGTTYKQQGRRPAILLGLDLIGPKMRGLVETIEILAGSPKSAKPFVLHCWRGGMRSQSVAWLLRLYGFKLGVLEGGYKSFRNWAAERFSEDLNLIVLGGHTGAGKTLLLEGLKKEGKSVVDLEGLANHRGSAFGSLGLPEQPTQQQFENELALVLNDLRGEEIWIEDEARTVGRCRVPNPIFEIMREATVIFIQKSVEQRLDFLVEIYGESDPDKLSERFENIQKRLGSERLSASLDFLKEGDIREAARIALAYYDKTYTYGLSKRDKDKVFFLALDDDKSKAELVKIVIKFQEGMSDERRH